jgi:hypothetical protein
VTLGVAEGEPVMLALALGVSLAVNELLALVPKELLALVLALALELGVPVVVGVGDVAAG